MDQIPSSWPLIGHAELGKRLMTGLDNNQLSTVLLFRGPAHVGKTTAALWLAQRDLCLAATRPCGQCASCHQMRERRHPSAVVLEANDRTSIGIEEVRQAVARFGWKATEQEHRWFIILEATHLTEAAAHALLKFTEEPPPHLHVLMTSSQPNRLLPTLRSRAEHWFWHLVPTEQLKLWAKPNVPAETAWLSRMAGRPGWAASVGSVEVDPAELEVVRAILRTWTNLNWKPLPADDSQQTADLMELCLREIFLASADSSSRLLWPQLQEEFHTASSSRSAASWWQVYNQFRRRQELLSHHTNPTLVYADLQII